MIDTTHLESLKWEFLASCDLDYSCLSTLVDIVREAGVADDAVQNAALAVLQSLLPPGLIEAGFPEGCENAAFHPIPPEELEAAFARMAADIGRDWPFFPWATSPEASLVRIASEWRALGRDPTYNEIAWFRATQKGSSAFRAYRASFQ